MNGKRHGVDSQCLIDNVHFGDSRLRVREHSHPAQPQHPRAPLRRRVSPTEGPRWEYVLAPKAIHRARVVCHVRVWLSFPHPDRG